MTSTCVASMSAKEDRWASNRSRARHWSQVVVDVENVRGDNEPLADRGDVGRILDGGVKGALGLKS